MKAPRFPAWAVPGALGKLLDEHSGSEKDEIILGCVLNSFCSLVTQGLAMVKGHDGQIHNLASSTRVVAPSGAGKSFHYAPLIKVVEDFILESSADDAPSLIQLFNDSTVPSMAKPLSENPIAGWFTDEAGYVLQGMAPKHYSLLNSYLDGGLIQRSRASGVIKAFRPFFSILHMVQDSVAEEVNRRHGTISRGCGFDARTRLAIVDEEGVGQETLHSSCEEGRIDVETRFRQLLEANRANGQAGMKGIPVITVDAGAMRELMKIQRLNQTSLHDRRYASCDDFLQKHCIHVIKVAASWHWFEGRIGDVSREYVERAAEVADYHLECWRYVRALSHRERLEVQDAKRLYEYAVYELGSRSIPHCDLRLLACNVGLHQTARRENALAVLFHEMRCAEINSKGLIKFFARPRGSGFHLS